MKARSSGCRRTCVTALIVASGAMVVLVPPLRLPLRRGNPTARYGW